MQIKLFSFLFFIINIFTIVAFHDKSHAQRIVIIDPAGDAKRTGRKIGDNFERGLTLQCAEKIKTIIEERTSDITVIITRLPGDTIYDLQNASLANRINADLFINLNFYHTHETKPILSLYQFSYGTDFAPYQHNLAFNSYEQAYKINKQLTDHLCHLCKQSLSQQQYHAVFTVVGPYALPIKPLIGIIAPSIAIEAGLKNKELWHCYCEPLADAFITAIQE